MKIDWKHIDIRELAAIVPEIKHWSEKERNKEKCKGFLNRLSPV